MKTIKLPININVFEEQRVFSSCGSHLGWAGHDMGKVGQLIEYNPKEIIQGE
jgi:hypothetical protein